MPLFYRKIRQNRGHRRGDFHLIKYSENHLTVCLCFIAKYDKIEAIGEAIFRAKNDTEKWARLVIKNYVFYYEPRALFRNYLRYENSLYYGLYFVEFCGKVKAIGEAIFHQRPQRKNTSRCISILDTKIRQNRGHRRGDFNLPHKVEASRGAYPPPGPLRLAGLARA